MQTVTLYLHFSLLFVLFGLSKLTLFDGSVGYGIVALQSRKSIRQGLMLSLVNLHFVLLLVDGALKSEAEKSLVISEQESYGWVTYLKPSEAARSLVSSKRICIFL